MSKSKLGIIAAPEFPTKLANSIVDDLTKKLNENGQADIEWETEVVTDPLAGLAEEVDELLKRAGNYIKDKEWDYIFCLTDLPDYVGDKVRLARVNTPNKISLISIPALGWGTQKQLEKIVIQIVNRVYTEQVEADRIGERPKEEENQKLKRFNFLRVHKSGEEDGEYISYFLQPKWIGDFWVLLGMAYANRPWQIMVSFRSVIAIAFATGAYGLIFPTLWMLSESYSVSRLIIFMLVAIVSMAGWIIQSNELWERPTEKSDKRIRKLYNEATLITLLSATFIYYLVLLALFFIFVFVVVPPDMYSSQVGLSGSPQLTHYIQLAWVTASLATMAGALGASLEDKENVKDITYGYRQRKRYEKFQEEKEKEEEEEEYSGSEDSGD